jgi:hypothetical protein
MSDALYLLGLVALTSWLAWIGGRRWLGLDKAAVRPALGRLLEWLGLAVAFYVLNLLVGVGAVVALRKVTGSFISLYVNTDATLLLLSAFQALVFQWWRADSE